MTTKKTPAKPALKEADVVPVEGAGEAEAEIVVDEKKGREVEPGIWRKDM